jgi:hypothetical protein
MECLRQLASHSEFESVLTTVEIRPAVDQAGRKSISGSDPVDEVGEVITSAGQKFAGCSSMRTNRAAGIRRFAQADRDGLQIGMGSQRLIGDCPSAHGAVLAQNHPEVFLVCEQDGGDSDHFRQDFPGAFSPFPQAPAVVQIER